MKTKRVTLTATADHAESALMGLLKNGGSRCEVCFIAHAIKQETGVPLASVSVFSVYAGGHPNDTLAKCAFTDVMAFSAEAFQRFGDAVTGFDEIANDVLADCYFDRDAGPQGGFRQFDETPNASDALRDAIARVRALAPVTFTINVPDVPKIAAGEAATQP